MSGAVHTSRDGRKGVMFFFFEIRYVRHTYHSRAVKVGSWIDRRNSPKFGRINPAQRLQNGCLGRPLLRPTHESHQARLSTRLTLPTTPHLPLLPMLLPQQIQFPSLTPQPPLPQPARKRAFPAHNLLPRALVEEIMHGNHRLNGVLRRVRVALAEERVVHLLGRRVFPPAAGAVGAGDRGDLALDAEVDGLVWRAALRDRGEHVV